MGHLFSEGLSTGHDHIILVFCLQACRWFMSVRMSLANIFRLFCYPSFRLLFNFSVHRINLIYECETETEAVIRGV